MFLMTSKGSRSRNCLLEGWTLQGIHVDRVTTHWNTMGDVQWKNVSGCNGCFAIPASLWGGHQAPPSAWREPTEEEFGPQGCYQCGTQGEVVCRTLSSSQYGSDEVALGREGTSQIYDDLGFGYSLVAAACPGVAACHPQAPVAALCSGKPPWQTTGCPY